VCITPPKPGRGADVSSPCYDRIMARALSPLPLPGGFTGIITEEQAQMIRDLQVRGMGMGLRKVFNKIASFLFALLLLVCFLFCTFKYSR
jgi:hypothetical protein